MRIYSGVFYRILLILFSTLLPALVAAASKGVIVGQSIDLSGPNGAIGRDYVAGIRTEFDAINAAGGIGGRRVTYLVRDDAGVPEATRRLVSELIEHDQVDYLFGGVGDATTLATLNTPAFRRSGLTLFAPLANTESARVRYWRPSYQQEIRYLLGYFEKLGVKRVGLAVQDSSMARAALDDLSEVLRKRGMTVSGSVTLGANGPTMTSAAKKLADSQPGFVVMIADTIGSAFFLKAFRDLNAKTFVAGTSLINLATLREIAGIKAVDWTVFSQVVPNPAGSNSALQLEHNAMMKKYRDEPLSSLTLEGFLVAKTLVKSLQPGTKGDFDLGGLTVSNAAAGARLSNYLDIALFKKGAGLVF